MLYGQKAADYFLERKVPMSRVESRPGANAQRV